MLNVKSLYARSFFDSLGAKFFKAQSLAQLSKFLIGVFESKTVHNYFDTILVHRLYKLLSQPFLEFDSITKYRV